MASLLRVQALIFVYSAQAKRAQKAKVPAEEEAEVVEEEVELPASAGDDGAGVGDIPLEARSREDTLSMSDVT